MEHVITFHQSYSHNLQMTSTQTFTIIIEPKQSSLNLYKTEDFRNYKTPTHRQIKRNPIARSRPSWVPSKRCDRRAVVRSPFPFLFFAGPFNDARSWADRWLAANPHSQHWFYYCPRVLRIFFWGICKSAGSTNIKRPNPLLSTIYYSFFQVLTFYFLLCISLEKFSWQRL